jgi:hypothetical protein
MLLSEARTKVLKLLDDEDGARYDAAADSSELDIALKSAMGEAWTQAIANGADLFVQEASFSSDSTGLVDLSASKVRRIDNVAQIISTTRLTVPCVNLSDIVNTMASVVTLKIAHIPGVTYPSAAGNAFVWGSSTLADDVAAPLNNLMCTLAACDLAPKDENLTKALQNRKDDLRSTLRLLASAQGWSVTPLGGLSGRSKRASFAYVAGIAPYKLQLVLT